MVCKFRNIIPLFRNRLLSVLFFVPNFAAEKNQQIIINNLGEATLKSMENRTILNRNLAQMLKGGVIMDVTTPEQAKIAEAAGACAVMALERIPADIRAAGGVSRMSDPKMIKGIQEAVSIPVMAKVRIGHFVEAQILEAIETILMRVRYLVLPMMSIILTSVSSTCLSFVVQRILVRLSVVSTRVLL